jgi:hypothetical protein
MAARVTKRGIERLFAEIDAYLRVVAAFRAEGLEPRWRRDPDPARLAAAARSAGQS